MRERARAAILFQNAQRTAAPGAMHQHAHRPQAFGQIHRGLHADLIGHIGHGKGTAQFGRHLGPRAAGQINDHHPCPSRRQLAGRGKAQPRGATGDNRHRISNVHLSLPLDEQG